MSPEKPAENHVVLLVVLALSIAVNIALPAPQLETLFGAAFILALCVAAPLAIRSHRPLRLLIPWGLAALGLHVAFPGASGSRAVNILDNVLWLGFSALLAAAVFRRVVAASRVGLHQMSGAISVYLLLGILFAQAYEILLLVDPTAIYFDPRSGTAIGSAELLYFSFVTLATVGYGDAFPASPSGRALCMLESVVGVLYIAVLVARFVTRFDKDHPDG